MGAGYSILEKTDHQLNSDHMSDDSSKGGMSDSHPETMTDHEYSDTAGITSSPPHSGDEVGWCFSVGCRGMPSILNIFVIAQLKIFRILHGRLY